MEIWPPVTSYMRMSNLSSVDLPLPDGPTMAHDVPAGMLTDTPRSTTLSSAVTYRCQHCSWLSGGVH